MFNIILRTLSDKRTFIIGWSLGLVLLAFVMVIVYPSFNNSGIDQLVEGLPDALKGLIGDIASLKELSTFLGSQLFDIRMPIFLSILTIILALGISVTEEEKGQLRALVSLPISRTKIVFGKWIAAVIISIIAAIATFTGVYLGIFSIGETIDIEVVLRLVGLMLLLVVAMVSLVFGIGMATGNRGLTMVIAIVTLVGGFLISTFAAAVDWVKDFEYLSIFYYYPAVDIAKGEIAVQNLWFYGVMIFVSIAAAVIFFRRRDVQSS